MPETEFRNHILNCPDRDLGLRGVTEHKGSTNSVQPEPSTKNPIINKDEDDWDDGSLIKLEPYLLLKKF